MTKGNPGLEDEKDESLEIKIGNNTEAVFHALILKPYIESLYPLYSMPDGEDILNKISKNCGGCCAGIYIPTTTSNNHYFAVVEKKEEKIHIQMGFAGICLSDNLKKNGLESIIKNPQISGKGNAIDPRLELNFRQQPANYIHAISDKRYHITGAYAVSPEFYIETEHDDIIKIRKGEQDIGLSNIRLTDPIILIAIKGTVQEALDLNRLLKEAYTDAKIVVIPDNLSINDYNRMYEEMHRKAS